MKTTLPPNQAASYNWAVGNRYQKRPWNSRKRPQNERLRCIDCSAQFHEATQATKMDMHCLKMGAGTSHGGQYGLHHGWRNAVGSNTDPRVFRIISDSVIDLINL